MNDSDSEIEHIAPDEDVKMDDYDDPPNILSFDDYDLHKALAAYDQKAVRYTLQCQPSKILERCTKNQNLPLHDIVDKYFDVVKTAEFHPLAVYNLVKNVGAIMKVLIDFGVTCEIGGLHGAGGLFETNREKIDFVTYRSRTVYDMLLRKFEMVLEYSKRGEDSGEEEEEEEEYTAKRESRLKFKAKIMQEMNKCMQYCIHVSQSAWQGRGCKNEYTLIHAAIAVFPLLKVPTLTYICDNFHNPGTFMHRDPDNNTILINAICEATKRKQWGDWKERFQVILDEAYCGSEQCWTRHEYGRLPIHIAIEKRLEWDNGLQELVAADSSQLLEPDPLTGLYPFASVASGKYGDLNLCFKLLKMNPIILQG